MFCKAAGEQPGDLCYMQHNNSGTIMFGDITQHFMLRAEKEREKYATLSTKLVNQQQLSGVTLNLVREQLSAALSFLSKLGSPAVHHFSLRCWLRPPKIFH